MSSFSCATVVGYASHLPLKIVKLPLKYGAPKSNEDASDSFKEKCFQYSELIDVSSQKGNFFTSVQIGLFNDAKTLRLTPLLADEATFLGAQFHNIDILLPHKVISKGTITYQLVTLALESEPFILIDLIEENYLLITLKIELSDFIVGSTTNRLALDNFSEWANISVPYSFELRSAPFFMKALDQNNIIVSMNDGGLLHFRRLSPLATTDIFNFSDAAPVMSLNFVGNLLKRPNKQESSVGGISSNAVVDVIRLRDEEFAALSVNKTFRVWNLITHKQSRSAVELDEGASQPSWLTTVPNKYFQIHELNGRRTLSILLTSPEGSLQNVGNEYAFHSWVDVDKQIEFSKFTVSPLHAFDQLNATDLSFVKIQDFQIVNQGTDVHFYILWKSNTVSSLVRYTQEADTDSTSISMRSLSVKDCIIGVLSAHQNLEYYQNVIFNSGYFDKQIVTTALSIFKKNSDPQVVVTEGSNLQESVALAVTHTSRTLGVSESSLWYKFTMICDEFRKLSMESLSILVRPNYVIVSLVNGLSTFSDAHYYEKFLRDDTTRLSKLLGVISSKFSSNTFKRVLSELEQTQVFDAKIASSLASKYLSGKITNMEINTLMEELDSIPGVVEEIEALVGGIGESAIVVDGDNLSIGEGYGLFAKLMMVSTFKNIKASHCDILIDLAVMFLLCEVNDDVLKFLNMIVEVFRGYEVMDQVFDLSFAGSSSESSIEVSTVSPKEYAVFWTAIAKDYPDLFSLIQRREYNVAYDYFTTLMLQKGQSDLVTNVVLELVNKNEGRVIFEQFIPKLSQTLPINRFLTGLVHYLNFRPNKFYDIFIDYSTFESVNDLNVKEKLIESLKSNSPLKHFVSSIFSGSSEDIVVRSNYYHQLAQLSKLYDNSEFALPKAESGNGTLRLAFKQKALEFEKIALATLQDAYGSSSKISTLKTSFLRNIFADSLSIKNFDDAIDSLRKLCELLSASEVKNSFNRLLRSLIAHHEIDRIFSPNDSGVFEKHYLMVDSILLELANDDLILSNALKCYEYLYSWRLLGSSNDNNRDCLSNRRGAAEALYIFVTRFKFEKTSLRVASNESDDFKQFKLKILELYMIILNCLKTFESDDDKWIIKRDSTKKLGVITLEELNVEYYRWLKELERDLLT